MLYGVPDYAVEGAWPCVAPFIERYLAKSKEHRWGAMDILDMLLERDMQLWIVHDDVDVKTVVLTQVHNFPRVRECCIFMVSGELQDDWRETVDELVVWAAGQGCHYVSAMARKGFAKVVGWDERQTYVVRAI